MQEASMAGPIECKEGTKWPPQGVEGGQRNKYHVKEVHDNIMPAHVNSIMVQLHANATDF